MIRDKVEGNGLGRGVEDSLDLREGGPKVSMDRWLFLYWANGRSRSLSSPNLMVSSLHMISSSAVSHLWALTEPVLLKYCDSQICCQVKHSPTRL